MSRSNAMGTGADNYKVFDSTLAGSWYSSSPVALRKEIGDYLAQARGATQDGVCALILPHAGYRYSGAVAAQGIRTVLNRSFRRVVILAPSHYVAMRNSVSIPDYDLYRSPLGAVPVDRAFLEAFAASCKMVRSDPAAHVQEHSDQIQVPLLQVALKDFQIAPIIVGQLDEESASRLAAALAPLLDSNTLVVASSDFTHFGPRFDYVPFTNDVPRKIEQLDRGAFDFIAKKDGRGFRSYLEKTGATVCGQNPVFVLLALLPADARVQLLKYDTSGRLTGDYENSVSYIAAAIVGRWADPNEDRAAPGRAKEALRPAELNAADRQALLQMARKTIAYALEKKRRPDPEDLGVPITAGMRQILGAFVTLKEKGDLRGCIGEIVPRRAVVAAVVDHASDAAFNDPRFSPLQARELGAVTIEISALFPPRPVTSWKDIRLGKHGIVLHKQGCSAVFLPQVAPEQGWTVAETLQHLALKAGLPADAWKEGAQFEVFEALVFGEEKE